MAVNFNILYDGENKPGLLERERATLNKFAATFGLAHPLVLWQSRIVDNVILAMMKSRDRDISPV